MITPNWELSLFTSVKGVRDPMRYRESLTFVGI